MKTYAGMHCLLLIGWIGLSGCAGPKADFYIAVDGNDAWSGTLAAPNLLRTDGPFATVTRARDAIRQVRKNAEAAKPCTVLVRGGTHYLAKPIVFEDQDSGTADGAIVYAAYPGEKPVLSGGRPITGWKKGDGPLWTAEIPDVKQGKWYFYQLFIDGRRCTRARTPNEGYLRTDGPLPEIKNPNKERQNPKAKMGFRFNAGDIKNWDNLGDVNVFTYQSWTAPLNWIASVDEEERIVRFTAPASWPIGYWERKQRYYVENYREALDAPGEWYLDRKTGVLSYWPIEGQDMTKAVAVAPVLRKLVRFNGDYKAGKFVKHIHLRGLSFQHAVWFVKDKGHADGQAAAWLEAAVFAQGTQHCVLEDCEIAHAGEYGLYFELGCKDNKAVRCHVHDLGAGGVRIGHMSSPEDDHGATERNVIDNCFIHDGGHVFRAGVGAWIGRSSHNTLSHNEICDFDYTGISVGWSWGYAPSSANHNVIEFNKVYNIGRGVLSDMGGIYSLGDSPGTVIRNNIFHDVYSYAYGGWGLYTDEGSTGIVMENNLVYNTKTGGFHQHYGKENIVRNNILAFSRQGQVQRSREEKHISFTFERNIVYFDNGYLLSSNWKNNNWRMDNNVFWDTSDPEIAFAGMSFDEWKAKGFDKNSVIADPQFVDAAHCDFRLKPDSPALKLGFKPIDISKIGLYGDPEWTALPKTANRAAFVFPPPPEPEAIKDSFEETSVGAKPQHAVTHEETAEATIRVTDQKAAAGKRSLKFTDKPGQKKSYNPHMYYRPNLRTGVAVGTFSLYLEPNATLYHEWRDSRQPYRVGPSVWFAADGTLKVANKPLMKIPAGKWAQFEIRCGLGKNATGTFDLVVTVAGQQPKKFEKLACGNPKFRQFTWCGFIAEGQANSVFYLDDVNIACCGGSP